MARQDSDDESGTSERNMYFDDEADEGNETPDDEGSAASNDHRSNIAAVQFTKKDKKAQKTCRHFSYALIANAVVSGWEDGEVAALILLVAGQLDLDEPKLIRCLEKTGTGSPSIISSLAEGGSFSFTVPQLVSILLGHAKNVDHFIHLMGEALECDLFDLTNAETIDVLFSFVENNMDQKESQRYARQLCEYSPSKRVCGQILLKFTTGLDAMAAASFICDIITLDFFQDVVGKMKDFLPALGPLRSYVEALLDEAHHRDKEGEIVDSDADSEGNLRDFVVENDSNDDDGNSDSESEVDDEQSAGSSGSEGNSERESDDDASQGTSVEDEEVHRHPPQQKHKHSRKQDSSAARQASRQPPPKQKQPQQPQPSKKAALRAGARRAVIDSDEGSEESDQDADQDLSASDAQSGSDGEAPQAPQLQPRTSKGTSKGKKEAEQASLKRLLDTYGLPPASKKQRKGVQIEEDEPDRDDLAGDY